MYFIMGVNRFLLVIYELSELINYWHIIIRLAKFVSKQARIKLVMHLSIKYLIMDKW